MKTTINYAIERTKLLCCFFFLINNTLFAQSLDWVNGIHGLGIEESTGLAIDNNGNVYSTGYFSGTINFEANGTSISITEVASGYQTYLQKIDALGNIIWVKTFEATGSSKIFDIHVDDLGNVYLTGGYSGTVDFDPGVGVVNKTALGLLDSFVAKLDASGNLIWVKTMDGVSSSYGAGFAIEVDAAYNVYITGTFTLTVDFDPGPGSFPLTTLVNKAAIYIQKLDAAGNLVWVKTMEGGNFSQSTSRAIAIDANGNVYTTGDFSGTVDFDPNSGYYPLTGGGIYIQKLDPNGNMLWTKRIPKGEGFSIALDVDANVYTNGYFNGLVDFDPGVGTYYLAGSVVAGTQGAGQPDNAYIHKLDTDGDFVWAKKITAFTSVAKGITLDMNGNVYSTGTFSDTADLDPNGGVFNLIADNTEDSYVQVLDKNGNFVWATNIGDNHAVSCNDIAIDGMGKIHLAGSFKGTADFDPSAGINTLTAFGLPGTSIQLDLFVLKLDASSFLTIEDLEEEFLKGQVYPNPSTGTVTIELGQLKNVSIRLFTMTGALVYHKENITDSIHQLTFDGPKGVYLLELSLGKNKQTYKLVKK